MKMAERILASIVSRLQTVSAPPDRAAAFRSLDAAVKQLDGLVLQVAGADTAHDYRKAQSISTELAPVVQEAQSASRAAGVTCA
jgi:hypothetical protein